jgi:hypothetical protein
MPMFPTIDFDWVGIARRRPKTALFAISDAFSNRIDWIGIRWLLSLSQKLLKYKFPTNPNLSPSYTAFLHRIDWIGIATRRPKQPYLQYQTLPPTELIELNQMAFILKPEVAQIQVSNESKFYHQIKLTRDTNWNGIVTEGKESLTRNICDWEQAVVTDKT